MDFSFSTIFVGLVVVMSILRRIAAAGMAWRKLAKRYAARRPSMGRIVHAMSMSVGSANLGPLVTFRISPRGLYMEMPTILHALFPSVMITWSDIQGVKYVKETIFRGYELVLASGNGNEDSNVEQITIKIPDKVIQAARMFIDIPEQERPA